MMDFVQKRKGEKMDDTISRQASIDTIIQFFEKNTTIFQSYPGMKDCIKEVIDGISSGQQKQQVLYYGDGYSDGEMVYDMAECPSCGYLFDEGDGLFRTEPFCPHCGQPLIWETEQDTA